MFVRIIRSHQALTVNIVTKKQSSHLSLTTTDVLAVGSEGSDEVAGGQEAVLVCVHDAEGLLELLDGGLGEGVEDVGFLRHGGGGGCGWNGLRSVK